MISTNVIRSFLIATILWSGCQSASDRSNVTQQEESQEMDSYNKGSFGYDLAFLKKKDSLVVLQNTQGDGKVVVSPKYQAKVFTSTAEGEEGLSFGWINYDAFDKQDEHMNAYGGEDRLWLGPEGGKFSLFFQPGTTMEFENWYTPPAIDAEEWTLHSATAKQANLSKELEITNYTGTRLQIRLKRQIAILENDEIEKALDIDLDGQVKTVGFRTVNTLMNNGEQAWDKQTGAPCLWSLDMFTPSPETVIIVPYHENRSGKVATTDYFGEIPEDRITYRNGTLLFKADGKSRGKLGIPPNRVKPVAGSYAADTKVLTITLFDVDPKATYLNQEWTPTKDPFTGDAMNAYNDGPLADGSQMGPFYEIESVSPAAFLKPREEMVHHHSVFHFVGDENVLDKICQQVLGASLDEVVLK
ncbi:hypothetical protein H8S90_02920 [Olivibacter sp. SDN3]|uniref:DUF6786 family protein n=1 Tax=Olivibacter sp. SDN3 TaxID=2764720 RepID=UPI00165102E3|nr:DUF6786 family protein [Olivibacter sp. SDN3]QNL50576.1 hypothetical protein H8S90_02920 [Olivibacter sp. SDN3]